MHTIKTINSTPVNVHLPVCLSFSKKSEFLFMHNETNRSRLSIKIFYINYYFLLIYI